MAAARRRVDSPRGARAPNVEALNHTPQEETTVLGTIIGLIVIGLIAGFIARAIVPGRQSMGIGATILLGIVGSFIGGFLSRLIFGDNGDGFVQPSSWIGSIIGAIIALLIYTRTRRSSRV